MPDSDLVPLNRGLLAGRREHEDIQAHTVSKSSKNSKNSKRLPTEAREHKKGLFDEVKANVTETEKVDLGDVEEQAVARRDMLKTKHTGQSLAEKNVCIQKEINNMQNINYIKLYEKAMSDNEQLLAEKQQLDALKEKHAKLASENTKLAEIISGKVSVEAEISHHERFREAVQTSLKDNKKLTEENQKLHAKLRHVTEENKTLQTKLSHALKENSDLEERHSRLDRDHGLLKTKLDTLKSSLDNKESALLKASESAKSSTSSMRVLETQIENLRDQLEQQARAHKNEVRKMTETLQTLQQHHSDNVDLLRKTQQENQDLRRSVSEMSGAVRKKSNQLGDHVSICCDILRTCKAMSRRYNDTDLAEALQESIDALENLD